MKQKLQTGDTILSLTEQSDNNWMIIKDDDTTINFDYAVWSNSYNTSITLYNLGHGIATVNLDNITVESKEFIESNIIV